MYSSDQNFVQRYAAARSTREARKAAAIYSAVALPTWTFFFLIGTCVFVFYTLFPDSEVGRLEADQVFPYFILTQIPAGLAGIVLAGVLAAAMSSLDSSINAIATITTVDLLKPYLAKGREDGFYLRAARVVSMVAAGLMVLIAVLFGWIEKESMNDLSWMITSVLGGCLMGLFMVGFFTTRVDQTAAAAALVGAILLNVYLGASVAGWLPDSMTWDVHSYWIGVIVNLAFMATAYVLGLVRPTRPERLAGLTVWTWK